MTTLTVEITEITSKIMSCASRGLGFTIIVFLTTQYFKPKSNHRSAYYVILNVGYAMDFTLFINWIIPIPYNTFVYTAIMLEWYTVYFTTVWNFVLCLNRCTALAFLVKYDRIWRPLTMCFIITFMLAFPFIVDGYALFNSTCDISDYMTCMGFRTLFFLNGTITNAILNGIGILLIAASMYKSSQDKFQANSTHAKTERRLIYQAIFSSLFQLISFVLKYSTSTNTNLQIFMTMLYTSDIVYHFQHLVVMGTHFILSPTFKISYLEFYHLKFLMPNRKTNLISIKSTTVKPFTSTINSVKVT